jgi:hypothetical protein
VVPVSLPSLLHYNQPTHVRSSLIIFRFVFRSFGLSDDCPDINYRILWNDADADNRLVKASYSSLIALRDITLGVNLCVPLRCSRACLLLVTNRAWACLVWHHTGWGG